jgi:hypothetical protein
MADPGALWIVDFHVEGLSLMRRIVDEEEHGHYDEVGALRVPCGS